MLRQRPTFNRLALAAALLLAVWQGLSLQHLHADEPFQADCAVCAAAQHDDAALDVATSVGSLTLVSAEVCDFFPPRLATEPFPAYGARAPPTR